MDAHRIPRYWIGYSLTCFALLFVLCAYGADLEPQRLTGEAASGVYPEFVDTLEAVTGEPGECLLCGGPEGLPCPEGMSCKLPPGLCDEGFYGTCGHYTSICLAVETDLCGCDGNDVCIGPGAYSGPIAHDGSCATDCGGATGGNCGSGAYCEIASGCVSDGVCRQIPARCADDNEVVCGCDGQTYSNPCVAAQAEASVAHPGPCPDSCLDDPDKTEPGVCGCGIADLDSDGDGAPDCVDACASDPASRVAGLLDPQFQVNQSWPCQLWHSAVGLGSDARSVVVWEHGGGLSGRIFDAEGLPLANEFRISESGRDPAVGVNPAGSFVVVFEEMDGEHEQEIFALLHDETGAPSGERFTVNTTHAAAQGQPSVAMDAGGNFVVVWSSYVPEDGFSRVFGRLFDAGGVPQGDEIQIYTEPAFWSHPAVAMDPAGNFVVTWNGREAFPVLARLFDSSGQSRGRAFPVLPDFSASVDSVAADASGNFVVAGLRSNGTVFVRRFDRDGEPRGEALRVNTTTHESLFSPELAGDAAGNFVVVWSATDYSIPADINVFGQRFAADGTPLGGEFRVNSFAQGIQVSAAIAANDTGHFVTTWASRWPFDSQYGVFAARGIMVDYDDGDGAGACYGPCDTPPAVSCCSPATGALTSIDDGDVCTEDLCLSDGTVIRERVGPADIGAVLLLDKDDTGVLLDWPAPPEGLISDVYRGTVAPGGPWVYDEACFAAGLETPASSDAEVPPSGHAFTYLVGVVEGACGGPIGMDADGAPRFADPSCEAF